jgi:DNA repair protein RadC
MIQQNRHLEPVGKPKNMVNTGHGQRLKDRFIAGEQSAITDEGILELLLSYAIPRKDVQPLARRLIAEYGSLAGVLAANFDVLSRFKGLGPHSAALLKVADRVRSLRVAVDRPQVAEPRDEKQASLFPAPKSEETKRVAGRSPRARSGMFGKAMLKEAIAILPRLPETDSIETVKEFLRKNLHFSAEQTRQRNANYITQRMFPEGHVDKALPRFAKRFAGRQELKDVCFYRFCKAEPLMLSIAEDLLVPAIGSGSLSRDHLREYLRERGASSKSLNDYTKAVVEALTAVGIARSERSKISFSYRPVLPSSFAFLIYSEFPEPGMYDIAKIEHNRSIRAMLWNPTKILHSLYELRNQGIISKVSEIDAVRQVTTRWTLDQFVQNLSVATTAV